jgi:hypothetical protein
MAPARKPGSLSGTAQNHGLDDGHLHRADLHPVCALVRRLPFSMAAMGLDQSGPWSASRRYVARASPAPRISPALGCLLRSPPAKPGDSPRSPRPSAAEAPHRRPHNGMRMAMRRFGHRLEAAQRGGAKRGLHRQAKHLGQSVCGRQEWDARGGGGEIRALAPRPAAPNGATRPTARASPDLLMRTVAVPW